MRLFTYVTLLVALTCSAGCDLFKDGDETVRRQMVVFGSSKGAEAGMNVWMMTPDGENLRQLTHYPEGDFLPVDVSPDGKTLLLIRRGDYFFASAIYLVPIDGPPPQEPLITDFVGPGSFFPDGQRFIYQSGGIFRIFDLRDSSSVRLSLREFFDYTEDPDVSPDGTTICFFGRIDEPQRVNRIYLMNVDGSNVRAITPETAANVGECSFSPDGRRVFFKLSGRIHLADVETGEIHEVAGPQYGDQPVTDTSGTRIFYVRFAIPNDTTQIYIPSDTTHIMAVDLDGRNQKQLTSGSRYNERPFVGVVEFQR